MATENLQIPDIQSGQLSKEVTANAAHNLLDRAMNGNGTFQKVITVSTSFTNTEVRENPVIELTGTPGAPFTVNMPSLFRRWLTVVNSTDGEATIRNSTGAGSNQPVIPIGTAATFYYTGTDFIRISSLLVAGIGNLYVPAEVMYGATGAPALATAALSAGNPVIRSWDLDQTTPETVQFSVVMPRDWNLGTIDVQVYWSHATGGSLFGLVLGASAVAIADDGAQDVAFGTQITDTDTGGTADDLYISTILGITVAGTPTDGKLVHFEIERVAGDGADTLDLDARIQGARIVYTKA